MADIHSRKKSIENFTDNLFEVYVVHSRVIGPKCFDNIPVSMGLLFDTIRFRAKYCSAITILSFIGLFSAIKTKDFTLKPKK